MGSEQNFEVNFCGCPKMIKTKKKLIHKQKNKQINIFKS